MKLFNFIKEKLHYHSMQERRARYQKRREYLDDSSSSLINTIYDEKIKTANNLNTSIDKSNGICPHCKGTNIIQQYHRSKGDIRSSGSFIEPSLSGDVDTLRVNKCNDCGNEWEYKEHCYTYDAYSNTESNLRYLIGQLDDIVNVEYDSSSISEEYNSRKEKKQALIDELKTRSVLPETLALGITIETLAYYFVRHSYTMWVEPEKLGKVAYNFDDYLFKFNKETTTLLEDLGFKHAELDEI